MKYAIVFSSKTGNTEYLANAIKKALGYDNCLYFGSSCKDIPQVDLLFIGFWTKNGKCDSETSSFLKALHNKRIFFFGTAGMGKSKEYFRRIIKSAIKYTNSDVDIIGSFMCQGRLSENANIKYQKMLKTILYPYAKFTLKNYELSLAHPNEDDTSALILEINNSIKAEH